jgi:TPR repeat protein
MGAALAGAALALGAAGGARADQFNNGMAAANAHDYATAVQIWRPLADEGSADAQNALGVMYDNGFGVAQDHAAAAAWFKKAADQGNAAGEFDLALVYDSGRGVAKSDTLAAFWYRRAADQGVAGAQLALGSMYAVGRSLPKDAVQAYVWLSLAANHTAAKSADHLNALKLRDQVAQTMSTSQVADAERLTDEWQPKPPPQ